MARPEMKRTPTITQLESHSCQETFRKWGSGGSCRGLLETMRFSIFSEKVDWKKRGGGRGINRKIKNVEESPTR